MTVLFPSVKIWNFIVILILKFLSALDKSNLLRRRGNFESVRTKIRFYKTSNVTLVHFSRSSLEPKGLCVGDFKLDCIVLILCSSLSVSGICHDDIGLTYPLYLYLDIFISPSDFLIWEDCRRDQYQIKTYLDHPKMLMRRSRVLCLSLLQLPVFRQSR